MMDAFTSQIMTPSHTMRTHSRYFAKLLLAVIAIVAVTLSMGSSVYAKSSELDEELQGYWSVDRDLPVVQQKLHDRSGRLELGIFSGLMSSEPFFYYFPVGGRLAYHFTDHFALELSGSYTDVPDVLSNKTELTEFLETRRRDAFDSRMHTEDRFLWRSNAVLLWSPFYGKLALLQRKMAHFDLNLALGAGVVGVERPSADRRDFSNEVAFEGVFGGGVQFYMSRHFLLRMEGRAYVYKGAETPVNKDSLGKQINVPIEFLLGVSYLF